MRELITMQLSRKEESNYYQVFQDERFKTQHIIGFFIYGSQALGIDTEASDVDVLLATLPTPD